MPKVHFWRMARTFHLHKEQTQLEGLRAIADEWSAKTGVKVQINVITWVEYWTLLEAGAMGGEMPDVFCH